MGGERPRNVLFLCTGNSARSILAEGLMNHLGAGRYRAFSAGSQPQGRVHPLALETLDELGIALAGARSKSWDEFAGPASPPIDVLITVCDNAAAEPCPVWRGRRPTAHWGLPDPAAVTSSEGERREAFRATARELRRRIEAFLRLDGYSP